MTDKKDQYYICLGASAGGLKAYESFFKAMPKDTGFSFIIVQHLSPDYKSLMDELLAQYTNMKIRIIEDGMKAISNEIYLIPSGKNLAILNGIFYLEKRDDNISINLPIDIFMKSLSKDQGDRAVGIILSGTGRDGASGIKSIKEAGGLVMAQSLTSSQFDEMPKNSISTGLVDYILSPEDMPDKLIGFIKHPNVIPISNTSIDEHVDFNDIANISLIMKDYSGIDFSHYKESTILRRLDRRLRINNINNIKDYVEILRKSDKEKKTLQKEFLIGVTSFFRNKEAFESLKKNVLPFIDYDKDFVRIWSAGCSTGEEVYSIAILFIEYIKKNNIDCEVKIFATDINPAALEIASVGFYSENVFGDMDSKLIDKYFIQYKNGYKIRESVRRMIVFAKHNILKDPPFSNLDLLICRNLFIYIKSKQQKQVLSNFHFSLKPNGYMFLGNSESVGDLSYAFKTIDSKWKIFKYDREYKVKPNNNINFAKQSGTPRWNDKLETKFENNIKEEDLLSSILSEVAPPSIIIDEKDNIVQVVNDLSNIVKVQPGKFSNKFNSNLEKDTCLFVNNIIRRLKSDTKQVLFSNIVLSSDSDNIYSLTGRKISLGDKNYFMISFEKNEEFEKLNASVAIDMSEEVRIRVKELENELRFAEEGLQATIEELETSNEELQSSNEELIASNEELQSTNEELQSVNEELYTVNNECQSKIEELTNLSNDSSNLMKNTELGALYLDERLYIRRVTPIVTDITNIRKSDVGRSIKDISVMYSYPDIFDDIESVLSDLKPVDREIKDELGLFWLIRIRPYRTKHNAIRGVIITFVNIDRLKEIQNEFNLINERLSKSLNLGDMAHWTLDVNTGHMDFSSTKKEMLRYEDYEFPKNIIDRNKLIHKDDIVEYEQALNDCIEGRNKYWDIVYRILRKDGNYSIHHDHGVVNTCDDNGKPLTLLGVITDITNYLNKY